jgi:hypothetical protein
MGDDKINKRQPRAVTVSVHPSGAKALEQTAIDTMGAVWLRLTLPDGEWFDIQLRPDQDGSGLLVMGESAFGVLPRASNVASLLPRGREVP